MLALLFAFQVATSQPTGSIAGCIVDAAGHPLPGVTVVATGESLRHTTETNTQGCYNLKGVAPGTYRVTTRLRGFTNVTRDKVAVAVGAPASLDLSMSVSPICECVVIKRTLAEHVKAADAILHVRIAGPGAGQPAGATSYHHKVIVLHTIKPAGDVMPSIDLAQDQTSGSPDPYDVDQEMLVFLQSTPSGYRIVNTDAGQGGMMMFFVRDGRIVEAPADFAKYVGATLDSFMYELRHITGQ